MPYTYNRAQGIQQSRAEDWLYYRIFDSSYIIDLPMFIESVRPDTDIRNEIPSSKGAEAYSHLKDIAEFIPYF